MCPCLLLCSGFQLSTTGNLKLSPQTFGLNGHPKHTCHIYSLASHISWHNTNFLWWFVYHDRRHTFGISSTSSSISLAVGVHYNQTSAHFSALCPSFLDAWLWSIKQSTETVITFSKPRLIGDLNFN